MLDTTKVMLDRSNIKAGLYESYYYRGNGKKYSFWLKHNLLSFKNSDKVSIENTFVLFDKENPNVRHINQKTVLSSQDFLKLYDQHPSWKHFEFPGNERHHFLVDDKKLEGSINDANENVRWDFNLTPHGTSYLHFSPVSFYFKAFPKKKILTNDIRMVFDGSITFNDEIIEDQFIGMNGHNWGKEHAYKYAYANCNQFDGEDLAFFDGFSAKIKLAKIISSPYLSCGSLYLNGTWFHFTQVLQSYKHKVNTLEKKKWDITFLSQDHILEVQIDGENQPWITLDYDHPSRKVSQVHNTKFAHGRLVLKDRKTKHIIKELHSKYFELESLIP